jgi:hypothetical protein
MVSSVRSLVVVYDSCVVYLVRIQYEVVLCAFRGWWTVEYNIMKPYSLV